MTLSCTTDSPPRFSVEEACALARDLFAVKATARPLPSERDQNFLLETHAGPEFVLKIAHAGESRALLEAQHAALEHLRHHAPDLRCPRVRPTTNGEAIVTVTGTDGRPHCVRLLTYVPGHLMVEAASHSPALLRSLGAFLGRLDRALATFAHSAFKREHLWDLRRAGSVVTELLAQVSGVPRRSLVERFLSRFRTDVEPVLPQLRRSVIYNDGNDYNLLVTNLASGDGEVTGVIDFGDLIEAPTVFEVAVAAAYAILDKPDPLSASAAVVGGYHDTYALTEVELGLLYDLIAMRLCVSVTLSAARRTQAAENPYLTVSEAPAWAALERLAQTNPRLFHYAMRAACGLPPCPQAAAVVRWLEAQAETLASVVEPDVQKGEYALIDLSPGSADFAEVGDLRDIPRWTDAIFGRMRAARARVGIGRYDEPRRGYTSAAYRPIGTEVEDWRTIHLGVDLFLTPGSPVFAPLDGTVHSLANNNGAQDYGPTIILRHAIPEGEFYTLYGHLSVESLSALAPGQKVSKGTRLGSVGESSVNGGWPPHLHVQVIVDLLDQAGTFPGLCAARDRIFWRSLCPDPNLLLRIPNLPKVQGARSPEAIVAARKRLLGPNLFVSYRRPVTIVQGWMQYQYDHLGREYLDATDNVAHVGHGHPAVVRAAAEQMRVLNTNTRYLHESLVEYAERLTRTLPEPLRVCYLVNSGSEANELALRLARAHTHGTDLIVLDGAYHGNTTALVDISPYKFDGPGGAGAPAHVHKVPLPDVYRGQYREAKNAGPVYAQHVRSAVERIKRMNRRLAAFFCESLPSCAGQIVPPPGYLAEAYRFIRKAGGVCIADEIQTGFGRVGSHFWGFELQGVVPDIVTMGKPIGNGHPIGAVVTTPELAASFASGGMEYFSTFGGNPVSCAVGLAVLDVVEREGLQAHARTVGLEFTHKLNELMARHPMIGDVRGEGLFLGVELVRDRETREPAGPETAYVSERLKDLGVLVGTDGLFRNVLKIKPPMVFTADDAERFTRALDRVLSEPRLRLLRNPL